MKKKFEKKEVKNITKLSRKRFTFLNFVEAGLCFLIFCLCVSCTRSPTSNFAIVAVNITSGDTAVKSAETVAVEAIRANAEVVYEDGDNL